MTANAPTETPAAAEPVTMTYVPELLHLQTILVATDFSPPAEKALHYAQRFAQQFGSKIVVLHVIEPVYPYPVDGLMHFPGDLQDPMVELRPAVEKSLERLAETAAQAAGVVVRPKTRVGRAWREITEAATAENADAIVIATHGRSGLAHVLLGSTAEKVVRHAPCPVLVVREKEHDFA